MTTELMQKDLRIVELEMQTITLNSMLMQHRFNDLAAQKADIEAKLAAPEMTEEQLKEAIDA